MNEETWWALAIRKIQAWKIPVCPLSCLVTFLSPSYLLNMELIITPLWWWSNGMMDIEHLVHGMCSVIFVWFTLHLTLWVEDKPEDDLLERANPILAEIRKSTKKRKLQSLMITCFSCCIPTLLLTCCVTFRNCLTALDLQFPDQWLGSYNHSSFLLGLWRGLNELMQAVCLPPAPYT